MSPATTPPGVLAGQVVPTAGPVWTALLKTGAAPGDEVEVGAAVGVAVGVRVGSPVCVGVGTDIDVIVEVGVNVGVVAGVGVAVGVRVAVAVGVTVDEVGVGEGVARLIGLSATKLPIFGLLEEMVPVAAPVAPAELKILSAKLEPRLPCD